MMKLLLLWALGLGFQSSVAEPPIKFNSCQIDSVQRIWMGVANFTANGIEYSLWRPVLLSNPDYEEVYFGDYMKIGYDYPSLEEKVLVGYETSETMYCYHEVNTLDLRWHDSAGASFEIRNESAKSDGDFIPLGNIGLPVNEIPIGTSLGNSASTTHALILSRLEVTLAGLVAAADITAQNFRIHAFKHLRLVNTQLIGTYKMLQESSDKLGGAVTTSGQTVSFWYPPAQYRGDYADGLLYTMSAPTLFLTTNGTVPPQEAQPLPYRLIGCPSPLISKLAIDKTQALWSVKKIRDLLNSMVKESTLKVPLLLAGKCMRAVNACGITCHWSD
jgi:hypothetical protein